MIEDFAITAALLKAGYAVIGILLLVWVSSWLDRRAVRALRQGAEHGFGAVLATIRNQPLPSAIYYGARIVAVAMVIAALMGCATAQAGQFPTRYDGRIKAAVETYWPDYPAPMAWKAQLYQESRLNPAAVSPVGAAGLAQMMPGTWADLTRELRLGAVSPHHAIAIEAGAYYMAKLRRVWRSGRTPPDRQPLAQASYNAGTGNIIAAQRACGGARMWADIAACLAQVTGARNAHETTTYVARIAKWRAMMEAGL